jgi:hypothetical protein
MTSLWREGLGDGRRDMRVEEKERERGGNANLRLQDSVIITSSLCAHKSNTGWHIQVIPNMSSGCQARHRGE